MPKELGWLSNAEGKDDGGRTENKRKTGLWNVRKDEGHGIAIQRQGIEKVSQVFSFEKRQRNPSRVNPSFQGWDVPT